MANDVTFAGMAFVFMGVVVAQTGLIERLIRLFDAIFGRLRGGAAYVSSLGSAAVGLVAGSTAGPWPTSAGEGRLGQSGLERVFEAISQGVDATGQAAAPDFLARLVLLLAEEVGDADRVLDLVAAARISAAPSSAATGG